MISCCENTLKSLSATAQSKFFSQTIPSVLFEEILLKMNKYQLFVILFLIGTIFVCENVETDAKATLDILERNARNIPQRRGKGFFSPPIYHACRMGGFSLSDNIGWLHMYTVYSGYSTQTPSFYFNY
jgi:hypothetical protein